MEELPEDLIYLLFDCYFTAPHILVSNRNVYDIYNDIDMNECCHYYIYNYSTYKYANKIENIYINYKEKSVNGIPKYFCCKTINNVIICIYAVTYCGNFLNFVPEHLRDYSLCMMAVSNNGSIK